MLRAEQFSIRCSICMVYEREIDTIILTCTLLWMVLRLEIMLSTELSQVGKKNNKLASLFYLLFVESTHIIILTSILDCWHIVLYWQLLTYILFRATLIIISFWEPCILKKMKDTHNHCKGCPFISHCTFELKINLTPHILQWFLLFFEFSFIQI